MMLVNLECEGWGPGAGTVGKDEILVYVTDPGRCESIRSCSDTAHPVAGQDALSYVGNLTGRPRAALQTAVQTLSAHRWQVSGPLASVHIYLRHHLILSSN